MHLPCDNPCIQCEPSIGGGRGPVDPANPFANLSSEAPDFDAFIGRRYTPPGWQPPLGDIFYAVGCIGWCISTVSQEEANLCAARQANLCLRNNWPNVVPNPNFPPGDPTVEEPRELFSNTAQFCTFNCPDGTPFTFTTAAGAFTAFSQAAADAAAYSYACNQAVAQRICLNSLTPSLACADTNYEGSVSASSGNLPLSFEVVGSLPAGLVLSQNLNTLFITGVPTEAGDYTFTVVATDLAGHSMQKECSLTLFGFVNDSPLPEASLNEPYSVTLVTAGTVPGDITFEVTIGSLPDGLTLNPSTGEISGTPTLEGPFSFTVSAINSSIICSKSFGLQVENNSCPNWSELSWGSVLETEVGGAATFSPPQFTQQANCEGNLNIDSGAASIVSIAIITPATVVYNGPGCSCNVRVEINRVGAPNPGQDGMGVIVISTLFGILVNTVVQADGITDIPFNLPDTLGADDTIEVHVPMSLDNIFFGGGAVRSMQVLVQLSNV